MSHFIIFFLLKSIPKIQYVRDRALAGVCDFETANKL